MVRNIHYHEEKSSICARGCRSVFEENISLLGKDYNLMNRKLFVLSIWLCEFLKVVLKKAMGVHHFVLPVHSIAVVQLLEEVFEILGWALLLLTFPNVLKIYYTKWSSLYLISCAIFMTLAIKLLGFTGRFRFSFNILTWKVVFQSIIWGRS